MLCVNLYRISNFLYKRKLHKLAKVFYFINKIINSAEISPKAIIGRVNIYHSVGVVIGGDVIIKDDVTIMSGVVLGANGYFVKGIHKSINYKKHGAPIIKKNVFIGANSCILGNITLGENAVIGANAVVTKDVPDNSIAIGVPAKIYKIGELKL